MASDRTGIPIGFASDGANRNGIVLLEPTLEAIDDTGLLADIGTLSVDRGYDYPAVRAAFTPAG